jgi:hypothetical protein
MDATPVLVEAGVDVLLLEACNRVGTLLVETGFDIDTVRRWLGQKTLAMAIHYSETAETTDRMAGVLARFDPLGSKTRT